MRVLARCRATVTHKCLHQVLRSFRTYDAKLLIDESLGSGCVAREVLRNQSEPLHGVKGTPHLFALLASYVSLQRPLLLCRSSVQATQYLGHLRGDRLQRSI
jgi:hypothetical protein